MGFDDGAVVIKIGREEPVASMDGSGKVIWARHNEIQTVNIKALSADLQEVCPRLMPRFVIKCSHRVGGIPSRSLRRRCNLPQSGL